MKVSEIIPGNKFGRFTVVGKDKVVRNGVTQTFAKVLCDCGTVKSIHPAAVGKTVFSCGCLALEVRTTHGLSRSNTYKNWMNMLSRTTNINNKDYHLYKDKKPDDRWKIFENFYADMGPCPKGFTLERVKTTEPYGPGNCVWASREDQGRNTTRTNWVRYEGVVMTRADLLKKIGLSKITFYWRLRNGRSMREAMGVEFEEVLNPTVSEIQTGT